MWSGCDDGMTRGSDPGRRIEKIVFQILPELGPGGRCTNRFMCGWRGKALGSAVYERLAMSQWVQGLMQVQPNCGAGRMEVSLRKGSLRVCLLTANSPLRALDHNG